MYLLDSVRLSSAYVGIRLAVHCSFCYVFFFFFQAEDGIRDHCVTGVQTCALPILSPPSIEIEVGQSAQLAATPRDRNGHPLSGRPVAWATSDAAVATVDGAGRVTGVTAGSATITATSEGVGGTAAVTVTAPPPPSGSCLDQTGPSLTLSGLQTSAFSNRNLAPSTKLDAATAQFTTP